MQPKYRIMFPLIPLHGADFISTDTESRKALGNVIDPERLPLSAEIVAEMGRLARWISGSLNWEYLPDPGPWRQDECDRFNRAVDEFLATCRRELGPDFEVVENFTNLREDPDLDAYLEKPKGFMSDAERSQWADVVAALQLPEKALPPGIRQVEPRSFPSRGWRPIAERALGPGELASRYGIRLREKSWEDLGPFRFAALDLANDEQVWLVKHLEGPIYVYADWGADVGETVDALTRALGLTDAEVPWRLGPDPAATDEGNYS